MEQRDRPSWDEYFMEIASVVARRTTCLRRAVGAVIVKDNRLLTSGYNGAPQNLAHCDEVGCLREIRQIPSGERQELCRGAHAEQNAIAQAACHGVSIDGGTLYVTLYPCVVCAKMLINAGIRRIVYAEGYADEISAQLINEAGLECVQQTRC